MHLMDRLRKNRKPLLYLKIYCFRKGPCITELSHVSSPMELESSLPHSDGCARRWQEFMRNWEECGTLLLPSFLWLWSPQPVEFGGSSSVSYIVLLIHAAFWSLKYSLSSFSKNWGKKLYRFYACIIFPPWKVCLHQEPNTFRYIQTSPLWSLVWSMSAHLDWNGDSRGSGTFLLSWEQDWAFH